MNDMLFWRDHSAPTSDEPRAGDGDFKAQLSAVTPIADNGRRNCGGSLAASARQSFAVIERPYGITARIIPANSKPATDAVVKMISEIKVTILSPKVICPLPSSPGPQKTAGVGSKNIGNSSRVRGNSIPSR